MEQATTTTTTGTTAASIGGAAAPAALPKASKLRRSRMLLRGESTIASFGVALAVILVSALGASAWWLQHTQEEAAQIARREQLNTLADLTSHNVEELLTSGELSAVRRLISETSAAYKLIDCRVVLADGQVIAASRPSEITAQKLPQTWRAVPAPRDASPAAPEGAVAMSTPIRIAGRGDADLQIVAPLAIDQTTQWEAVGGVGGIGVAAMVGLLLTYRAMRSRIRAAGSIREALLAIEAGETSAASLSVAKDDSAEAKAWNNLMAERERLRKQGTAERVRETLGGRGQGRGDLSAACDAMSHGLVLIDDNNRVTYANGAAAVFMRCKREELVGSEIGKYLQVDPILTAVREIVAGTGRRRTVHDIERKDDDSAGSGVLRFNVRPVRREDAASVMITIEDITQQKMAEEARNSFVAQATHELRTPLTNIRLYVETAIEDGEADPATRSRCLNVINGETRRLERIVGEMLSVAEIEAGSFKINRDDVRLETVFEDLKADYAPQAKDKEIELAFNLPPKFPQIEGDRDKVMMALHNLIGNALKYTPSGGKVSINVSTMSKNLVVEVQDSGIGISQEDAERIFERFYRAKDPRVNKIVGTGLGLTLAREVVRLHGGDIAVDSQINQGSTFTMTLPLMADAA